VGGVVADLEGLAVLLRRHRADDTVTKAIARVLRADLVAVDDIGLLPVATDAAEGLYRLVDAAYETSFRRDLLQPPPHRPATSSCSKPWPPRPSTGRSTTPTSARPSARASD